MTKLGAIFYPTEYEDKKIPFESLYIPYIYKEIYFDGVYIDVLNQRRNLTIIDIGANIGITVQHFQPYAKVLHAVEPSPEHYVALKKNKEYNNWDNVKLHEIAIADKDGEMTLNINEQNRTCNSLTMDYQAGGVKVKTKRMDTFFKENKIKEVDFMKFDVEGAEDMILRSEGFKNVADKIKAIEIEFHFPNWPKLADYMLTLGYTARRFKTQAIILLFTR